MNDFLCAGGLRSSKTRDQPQDMIFKFDCFVTFKANFIEILDSVKKMTLKKLSLPVKLLSGTENNPIKKFFVFLGQMVMSVMQFFQLDRCTSNTASEIPNLKMCNIHYAWII